MIVVPFPCLSTNERATVWIPNEQSFVCLLVRVYIENKGLRSKAHRRIQVCTHAIVWRLCFRNSGEPSQATPHRSFFFNFIDEFWRGKKNRVCNLLLTNFFFSRWKLGSFSFTLTNLDIAEKFLQPSLSTLSTSFLRSIFFVGINTEKSSNGKFTIVNQDLLERLTNILLDLLHNLILFNFTKCKFLRIYKNQMTIITINYT